MVGPQAEQNPHADDESEGGLSSSRRVAEGSDVPIAHVEGAEHRVAYANLAFAHLVGRSVEELQGAPLADLIELSPETVQLLRRVQQTFTAHVVRDVAYRFDGEHHGLGTLLIAPLVDAQEPAGRLALQLLAAVPPTGRDLKDANEQLLLSALRQQELTERAKRSAAKLAAILENMSEGVTVFNVAGEIVLINPRGREILGFSAAEDSLEAYRRCRMTRGEGEEVDFHRDILARLLAGERFTDEEVHLQCPDGVERDVLMSGSAVLDDRGAVALAIKVYRDVSKMRELEQTRQLYFSLVSHDLRGPLSAATITAAVLERDCGNDEKCQKHTRRIRRNLERIDQMVQDMLDAQRIGAGEELSLQLEEHDLVAIADGVVTELETLHGERFVLTGEMSLPGVWSADQVHRAIWNLATNAVKYGESRAPVTIAVSRRGDRALVSVHNVGNPIPPGEEKRLFNPFSRSGPPATVAKKRGWGLGLTLVRGCAEAHGGRVHVKSSEEEGTTFTLELPIDARPHVHKR